jgi:hypothetical protein
MSFPGATSLVNCGGFGAGHLNDKPPRLNQFYSLDQVSLTDLALLEAGNSGQERAAIGDVIVYQGLQGGQAGICNAFGIALFGQEHPIGLQDHHGFHVHGLGRIGQQ